MPPAGPALTRIVPWCHRVLAEVLGPGDLAADLTAGNGHDTLFLARRVGPTGRVVAFDCQDAAVRATAERLRAAGVAVTTWDGDGEPPGALGPGVHLVRGDHAGWARWCPGAPRAAVANLGYLPGGDPAVATRPESTRAALAGALERLTPGGRVAAVCYVGHPGGAAEADAVEALFAALAERTWRVLRVQVVHRAAAPRLLVAERRR